ncbi:MAG: flavin reductase family protein [Gemmatimonadota bacterium]
MYWDLTADEKRPIWLGSVIVPRPVGWISTRSRGGVANLAPYSYFNVLSDRPGIVAIGCAPDERTPPAADRRKDTQRNIEETGQFVWNLATFELLAAVERSAQGVPPEVDEFALAGLSEMPSQRVAAPRVAESPVHAECLYLQTLQIRGSAALVFGEVVGLHVRDDLLVDHPTQPGRKRVDIVRARPLARLGGTYGCIERELAPEA